MTTYLTEKEFIPASFDTEKIQSELELLERKMENAVNLKRSVIEKLHPLQQVSAINLIQYLVLRSEDIRTLQDNLHIAGLSSLTSSESHILQQVQAIQERLGRPVSSKPLANCDYHAGRRLIYQRSEHLFGQKKNPNIPWLMVTFDSDVVDNFQMVKKLLQAGMNIARINCAHDTPEMWKNMITLVKEASHKTGIPCKIYMDMDGPKMRTVLLGKGRHDGKASLMEGQELTLAEMDADYDPSGVVISCSEPNVIRQLKAGERVLFDDGLIETRVESQIDGLASLRIVRISSRKPQIKTSKGINFPDSVIELPSITNRDKELIPFICQHADLIGYSFVREAEGISDLQNILANYQERPKIIIKIETSQAVKNLPSLLMQGMMDEVYGVMIARGDLAVEIGFERLSEIQEEISWISEAAHAPVVWATQVLETLNKSGVATRSEITDAYHAAMAECVMINKGDYTIKVMNTLSDILTRSGGHHVKKRFTFRPMNIAKDYFN